MSGVRVEVKGLAKGFRKGGKAIDVLRGIDLVLEPGEKVAVVGPSGSGKSTLMHLLGLLDRPSAGQVLLDGQDVATMSDLDRDRLRNQRIGFVFQAHNLLPEQSALGNAMMPVRLAGAGERVARERAAALLTAVGLGHRLSHQPGELSGGEQQRVAIARALAMGPDLVLADEPTGNLDPGTADSVFDVFMQLNEQLGSTLIVVTHSRALAERFPRRLYIDHGRLVDERDTDEGVVRVEPQGAPIELSGKQYEVHKANSVPLGVRLGCWINLVALLLMVGSPLVGVLATEDKGDAMLYAGVGLMVLLGLPIGLRAFTKWAVFGR